MARGAAVCSVLVVGLVQGVLAEAPASPAASAPNASVEAKTYTVPAGTKLLLSLKHEISTRVAKAGDAVYFTSEFPVVQEGAVVIPAGMYAKGVVDHVQRPGKVKGRAQLQLHLSSLIFPNGAEIAIPGTADSASGSENAKVKNSEGTVEADGTKGKDTGRIADATVAGAGMGAMTGWASGNAGMGASIGTAAGATAGVLTTLLTRGNDIIFPQGSTIEFVLARPLIIQQAQLSGMPQYTGVATPAAEPKAGPTAPTAADSAVAHK